MGIARGIKSIDDTTMMELRHLDTVPQIPTLEWRQRMAERALLRAVELDGQGSEDSQRERLRRHAAFADWLRRHARDPRYMPEVLSTGGWPEMRWSRLKTMPTERWRISVIDGSNMTRAAANQAALHWVTDAIGGRAPVFRGGATSKR